MQIPTGDKLRAARKTYGMTQSEVADRAGISQPLLSRVENKDVDPTLLTLHRIAQAINRSETAINSERLDVIVPSAISELRKDAGLTQRDLAEEADVSQPLIARIENNDVNPRASTLRSVLSVLDTDVDNQTPSDSHPNEDVSETEILSEIEESFERLPE